MPKEEKRMVFALKMWLKIISAVLAVILIVGAVCYFSQEQKECCLCSSFRYHAPCLLDLETGEMIELNLYFPHPTKVAELAEPQPEMGTFSFVILGDVKGTKLTDSKTIAIDVPVFKKTTNPALCRSCRKQLDGPLVARYMLVDLYDKERKMLIPIDSDLSMSLRCYEITSQEVEQGIVNVVIQGVLK